MPIDPLTYQQAQLGQTLERGLANLGTFPLQRARTEAEIAGLEYDIGLKRKQEARRQPIEEWQAMQAQQAMQRANQPIRMTDYMSTPGLAGLSFYDPKDEGKKGPQSLINEIPRAFNADWDTDPKSPTHNLLISKETGQPITTGQAGQQISALMSSRIGYDHYLDAVENNARFARAHGEIREEQFNEIITRIGQLRESDDDRLAYNQWTISEMSKSLGSDNPVVRENAKIAIERAQSNIDIVNERIEAKRKETLERQLAEIKKKTEEETDESLKKVPPRVAKAQDLFNSIITDMRASGKESLAEILARGLIQAKTGKAFNQPEIEAVKSELDEAKQRLLDGTIKILEDYYGTTPKKPEADKEFEPNEFINEQSTYYELKYNDLQNEKLPQDLLIPEGLTEENLVYTLKLYPDRTVGDVIEYWNSLSPEIKGKLK